MLFERIKELLREQGKTKRDLSEALGIGINTIKRWETEGRTPNAVTLAGIANYFGVSVDYLLGKTDIKKDPAKSEVQDGYYLLANRNGEGKGVEKLTKSEYEALMAVIKTLRHNDNDDL